MNSVLTVASQGLREKESALDAMRGELEKAKSESGEEGSVGSAEFLFVYQVCCTERDADVRIARTPPRARKPAKRKQTHYLRVVRYDDTVTE
jgi:hypothetical protein